MSEPITPDRDDWLALWISVGIAAVGAVTTIVNTVSRLTEVAPGHDIPVRVPLHSVSADLPLGPNGAAVTAAVDTATVTVADPSPATLVALWAEPIWVCVTVLAGLAVAALFFLMVARGQLFTRGGSRLALAGGLVVAAGWLGSTLLTNMTTSGALAAISDQTYESITFTVSLVPVLAILLLGGLGAALKIGERLQRETEGLV